MAMCLDSSDDQSQVVECSVPILSCLCPPLASDLGSRSSGTIARGEREGAEPRRDCWTGTAVVVSRGGRLPKRPQPTCATCSSSWPSTSASRPSSNREPRSPPSPSCWWPPTASGPAAGQGEKPALAG